MLKIKTDAKILSAESKPYDFNGNVGTSHKIRLSIDGEIYVAKSTAEQVKAVAPNIGDVVEATLLFDSRKENLSLAVDFE